MTEPTDHGETTMTLHQLIRTCMDERGWSYTDLERRSERALTRGRWQQLGSGVRLRNIPDPASLLVIARVLEIDITTVVLGAARTLGLSVRPGGGDLAQLLPEQTERLSPRMHAAILTLIRAAVADTLAVREAGVDEQPEEAESCSTPTVISWSVAAATARTRSPVGRPRNGLCHDPVESAIPSYISERPDRR